MTVPDRSRSDANRPAPGGCPILLSVERRLWGSAYTALRRVCCEFQRESGVLHLRGAVRSYYLKQVAQELVVGIDGVRLVNNQINVNRSTPCGTTQIRGYPEEVDPSSGT